MSAPSKKPSQSKKRPKVKTELPDDDAILQFFPKRAIDKINREIGHEATHRTAKKK